MKKIIKEGTKDIRFFTCRKCGQKWETDEYTYFELSVFWGRNFEYHSTCDSCGTTAKL